ncbi:MAG: HAD family phosphatase [Lachnospiraceae bacterium]|nr:HAD family phosphatase [Lachnospiraceae bacterium]
MNYDILYTDIDGTLLRNDKTVSERVLQEMKSYIGKGGRIVLSSGRPLPATVRVIGQLGLPTQNMYVIAFNGAAIYDVAAEQMIYEKRLPLSAVAAVLGLAEKNGIHCHTYTDDTVISQRDTPELHRYLEHIHMPYAIEPDIVSYLTSIGGYCPFKMLALTLNDRGALEKFASTIHTHLGDQLHTFFSAPLYLECCMKEASKGNAVSYLSDHLGIEISRTIAAGDAANDISMLLAAGTSYAMQNATEDVKQVAGYITVHSNNEDGILELFARM